MNTPARIQRKKTILIVEDSIDIQKLLQYIFASMPEFKLQFAGNGQEALGMIKARIPNLILSDIHMPLMDGIQLLTVLKSSQQWDDIPFIFITGDKSEEMQITAFEAGADDYIFKPIDKIDLFIRARSVLKRHARVHLKKVQNCLHGLLSVHNISDIIQMSAISNNTGSLLIQYNDIDVGYINIVPSKIHSAEYMDFYGEESLPKILELTAGSFIYNPNNLVTIKHNESIINKPIITSLINATLYYEKGKWKKESDFMIFRDNEQLLETL